MNIGFRVLPCPPRASDALLTQFQDVVTPHISDNMNRLYGSPAAIRPYSKGKLVGTAITVKTRPGDNLMVHKAIDMAEPGDVIVVDAAGDVTQAIVGEIMLSLAETKGIRGFVVDGAIRDSLAFTQRNFPIFARGITHRGPYKEGPGEINVPVCIAGMVVCPGDIIVGDEDGVIAIPQEVATAVLDLVVQQQKRERDMLEGIASGSVDRRWVDETLKAKGCEIVGKK